MGKDLGYKMEVNLNMIDMEGGLMNPITIMTKMAK
jgi:hypothetical protein